MTDKIIENNQVSIMGKIISGFVFSHEVFGEGFYMVDVSVQRLSESTDTIPVMISERLIDVTQDYQGEYIQIFGQFRSYNRHEEKKNRLVLSVFAREISFVDGEGDKVKSNQIFLDGYICKTPIYRRTPLGREIVRYAAGGEPAIWKVRLHSVHLLGKKCALYLRLRGRRPCSDMGPHPEP